MTYYLPVKLSMKFKNPFIHGSLLIRKEVLKEIGVMMKIIIMLRTICYLSS